MQHYYSLLDLSYMLHSQFSLQNRRMKAKIFFNKHVVFIQDFSFVRLLSGAHALGKRKKRKKFARQQRFVYGRRLRGTKNEFYENLCAANFFFPFSFVFCSFSRFCLVALRFNFMVLFRCRLFDNAAYGCNTT